MVKSNFSQASKNTTFRSSYFKRQQTIIENQTGSVQCASLVIFNREYDSIVLRKPNDAGVIFWLGSEAQKLNILLFLI